MRLQGFVEHKVLDTPTGKTSNFDFYGRRMRFQSEMIYQNDWKLYFDLRNDRVNQDSGGERNFAIGDGYLQKKINKDMWVKLFRAKVDMSYSQTVSSSRLLHPTRSRITDFASDYVSEARRASNLQLNGILNEMLYYQVFVGKSTSTDALEDLNENTATSIAEQGPTYGAKLRLHIYGDPRETLTETFYDKKLRLMLGLGHFRIDQLTYSTANVTNFEQDRAISQAELVFTYGGFTLISEYFHLADIVENFTATSLNKSDSSGYYVMANQFISDDKSIFTRFEDWQTLDSNEALERREYMLGGNYYYSGNRLRFGGSYAIRDDIELSGEQKEKLAQAYIMLHF